MARSTRVDHGGMGGKLEGMINLPIGDNIAFRASRLLPARCGLHRQRPRHRATYYVEQRSDGFPAASTVHATTRARQEQFQRRQTPTAAAPRSKIDLDDNWTVTPTFMYQKIEDQRRLRTSIRALGDLKIAALPQGTDPRPASAGGADRRGQDRQFRHHLCRRLHGPAESTASTITPTTPTPMTALFELRRPRRLFLFLRTIGGNHASIPQQYIIGTQPLQEDEPGAAHRLAARQAVPRHRRPVLPAPDRTTFTRTIRSTISARRCRSTASRARCG